MLLCKQRKYKEKVQTPTDKKGPKKILVLKLKNIPLAALPQNHAEKRRGT